MRADDSEFRLVLLLMVLTVAVPSAVVLGLVWAALLLLAPLAWTARRLVRLAVRPDPWRRFEQALDELGVVVAGDHVDGPARPRTARGLVPRQPDGRSAPRRGGLAA